MYTQQQQAGRKPQQHQPQHRSQGYPGHQGYPGQQPQQYGGRAHSGAGVQNRPYAPTTGKYNIFII